MQVALPPMWARQADALTYSEIHLWQYATINQSNAGRFDLRVFVNYLLETTGVVYQVPRASCSATYVG